MKIRYMFYQNISTKKLQLYILRKLEQNLQNSQKSKRTILALEWRVLSNLMPIAINNDKIVLSSEKKTEELAFKLSQKLKPGNIVFLYGEMGVGKTTFIRYLINEIQKQNKSKITEVTSPTFNILNEYQIEKIKINHYDLFRLKLENEIKNLDLFSDKSISLTLIEWPQIIKEKPENLVELIFEYEKDYKKRSVQIKGLKL